METNFHIPSSPIIRIDVGIKIDRCRRRKINSGNCKELPRLTSFDDNDISAATCQGPAVIERKEKKRKGEEFAYNFNGVLLKREMIKGYGRGLKERESAEKDANRNKLHGAYASYGNFSLFPFTVRAFCAPRNRSARSSCLCRASIHKTWPLKRERRADASVTG